jgi:Ankyrin repeats (3 copies)
MKPRTFGWQSDDLEHTADIEATSIRWATVTDSYDDDRPYTAETEQRQPTADFLAGGPAVRAPIPVIEEMLAALGASVPWLEALRLQYAAAAGDLAATRALLRAGAPPNAVVRGRTALSAALESEQLEAAACLLEGGSQPNVRLDGGATALHVAAQNAKSSAWVGMLRALLAAGADLEARAQGGQTPLVAGLRGHLSKDGVEVLVAARKAVGVLSDDGATPLITEARGWARPSVVRLLLAAGADVNARSKDGWSALLWAITKHDARLVKTLIDAGADVKVVGQPHKQGQPPRSALALAESYAGAPARADAGPPNPQIAQIVDMLRAAGAVR